MRRTEILRSKGAGRIGVGILAVLLVAATVSGILLPLIPAITEDGFAQLMAPDAGFQAALNNTLLDVAVIGVGGFVLAWLIACGLDAQPERRKYAALILLILPMACPTLVQGAAMRLIQDDAYGIINGYMMKWKWLAEPIGFHSDVRIGPNVARAVQLLECLGPAVLLICAGMDAARRSGSDSCVLRVPLLMAAAVMLMGTLGTESILYGLRCDADDVIYHANHWHWLQVMHQGPAAVGSGSAAAPLCVVTGLALMALMLLAVPVWLLTRRTEGSRRSGVGVVQAVGTAVAVLVLLLILVLVLLAVFASFMTLEDIFVWPSRLIPTQLSLCNFQDLAIAFEMSTPGAVGEMLCLLLIALLLSALWLVFVCWCSCAGAGWMKPPARVWLQAMLVALSLTASGLRFLLPDGAHTILPMTGAAALTGGALLLGAEHLMADGGTARRLRSVGIALLCALILAGWHGILTHQLQMLDLGRGVGADLGRYAAFGMLQGLPSVLLSIPAVIGLFPVLSAAFCAQPGEHKLGGNA